MRLPAELVPIDCNEDSFAAEFHWHIATERCMDTITVVETFVFV